MYLQGRKEVKEGWTAKPQNGRREILYRGGGRPSVHAAMDTGALSAIKAKGKRSENYQRSKWSE